MTIEAPLHVHRVDRKRQRHLIHPSVTSGATDSLMDVNAVIEIGEAGQIVNARPGEWLACAKTRAHRLKHLAIRPDLRMTVHADRSRRHARERRFFHRGVAIAAIDSESANVMLVTERYGLSLSNTDICQVGGTANGYGHPGNSGQQKDGTKDAHARQRVGAAVKNPGHRSSAVRQVTKAKRLNLTRGPGQGICLEGILFAEFCLSRVMRRLMPLSVYCCLQ